MTQNDGHHQGPNRSDSPLSGVRVVELGNYIAAPTAGRLLADFGAEVIKIERPGTGDELRNWRLHAGSTSMLYRTINRNKKSVVLDLRSPEGREAVLKLVECSDVLIENFRPGTLERWGLGVDRLAGANPELILVRISGFGQSGPLASRPGFGAVAEAWGGLRALVGEPDRPPARVGVSLGDSLAGLYAAFGAVMSLFEREKGGGRGADGSKPDLRVIDVALHEAVFSVMESLVPDYTAYGIERERAGGRLAGIAPSNAYLCKDGSSVVIAGNGDSIFARLMRAVGRPDLARDRGLATNAQRWAARDMLDDVIGGWTSTLTREEVLDVLERAEVPSGPINSAADILNDPQFAARGMLQRFQTEIDGQQRTVTFPGIVPLLGPVSLQIDHPGPDLGEHTDEVLEMLRNM